MSYLAYKKGIIDCNNEVDTSHVNGKSVIVTGGAKGMGGEAVRAFAKAGAYVTFGDLDEESGNKLEEELGANVNFVRCDVTSWVEQLALFKSAVARSPNKGVDVVIANAGISGPDALFAIEDSEEPDKPELNIVNVNMISVMYTMKLARHYFMKHPLDQGHDRCFIINASLIGYLDLPGAPQYMAAKWGCRALMRCLRRNTVVDGIRANLTGPWYVGTSILSPRVQEHCKGNGIVFAEAADCAGAMLKIASDPSINGRSFAIVPRDLAVYGYYDIGKDDYAEGEVLDDQQDILLRTSHRLRVKDSD